MTIFLVIPQLHREVQVIEDHPTGTFQMTIIGQSKNGKTIKTQTEIITKITAKINENLLAINLSQIRDRNNL